MSVWTGKGTVETEDRRAPDAAEGDGELPVPWSGSGRPLSSAEVERVIRRASDLQFEAGATGAADGLEEGELIRIGEEVGLGPRYVRQALAEVRADSLVPALPSESSKAARVFGSGLVRASRVVPGNPPEVEDRVATYFRDHELLKPVRSQPGRSLWEPAGGLLSTMRRAMDVGGRGYELAKARNIAVDIEPLESGWSLVTVTADLRNARNEAAAGWYLGGVFTALGASISLLVTGGATLPLLLGSGLISGAVLGTATWATGKTFRKRWTRMEMALQGFLDRVERGEELAVRDDTWSGRWPPIQFFGLGPRA
jgi:hypothetical protein